MSLASRVRPHHSPNYLFPPSGLIDDDATIEGLKAHSDLSLLARLAQILKDDSRLIGAVASYPDDD